MDKIKDSSEIAALDTERANEASEAIDRISTLEMVTLINREDQKVAKAVEAVLPDIAAAVDAIYARVSSGGRLIYAGAGTSGRLGVLDASECPPTFGTPESMVVALMAGGAEALTKAVEGAEDDAAQGAEALKAIHFSAADTLVGLAASGRTPYVLGAMDYARKTGGLTIGIACTRNAALARCADICIIPLPGPEVITGSTRLKSGTAQKMILNMLSTGVMVKMGKVYGNLMVDVKATNIKLIKRAQRIVMTATGVTEDTAAQTLEACGYSAKHAILMLLAGVDSAEADRLLTKNSGRIADALSCNQ